MNNDKKHQGRAVERFNDRYPVGARMTTSHGLHYEAKGVTVARAELQNCRAVVLCNLEGDGKHRLVPLDKLWMLK